MSLLEVSAGFGVECLPGDGETGSWKDVLALVGGLDHSSIFLRGSWTFFSAANSCGICIADTS